MHNEPTQVEALIQQASVGDTDAWTHLRASDVLAPSVRTPALLGALVEAGRHLGWGPERALRRMTVVGGRVCLTATAAVSLVFERLPDAKILPQAVTAKGARLRAQRSSGDPWSEFSYSAVEARNAGLTAERRWRYAAGEMCWERALGRCCVTLFADLFADVHFDWEARARRSRSTAHTAVTLPLALVDPVISGSAA